MVHELRVVLDIALVLFFLVVVPLFDGGPDVFRLIDYKDNN